MSTKISRPSCIDVAKQAGVSQATVSRVFSPNAAKVSPKSRDKVMKAAAALNYHPNIIARGLSKNSTSIIGVIVTRFENSFYTESIQYFTKYLQNAGYTAMVFNCDPDEMENTLPLAFQYQVDGIIIASASLSKALVAQCAAIGTPVVAYNRYSPVLPINAVGADNFRIGLNVAEYLCSLGHRRISFVGGNLERLPPVKDRLDGFVRGLEENGRRLHSILYGGNQYQDGYTLAQKLLDVPERPDALFCVNFQVAIGVIDAARDLGLAVPDDVSVVGFYDHPLASSKSYNLTTVKLPVEKIAGAAVDILLGSIRNQTQEVIARMFPGEIVKRGSVIAR